VHARRETAKLNDLGTDAHLADVIDRLAKGHPINHLAALLPWRWQRLAAKLAACPATSPAVAS
jgi:hypothetical protein